MDDTNSWSQASLDAVLGGGPKVKNVAEERTTPSQKKLDLGDYLKSINRTKVNLMRTSDDPRAVSAYPAFIARRMLSRSADAILLANEINCIHSLDNQMQYEFFLMTLAKRDRFVQMEKSVSDENLDLIKRFYNYSEDKALAILPMHTEEMLATMRARLNEGGIIRSK
jgi:hypothetical protein